MITPVCAAANNNHAENREMSGLKKTVAIILALVLLVLCAAALAETKVNAAEKRNITINKAGLNEVEDGISPTTGLTLADLEGPDGFAGLAMTGVYLPILVQIDNSFGGLNMALKEVQQKLGETGNCVAPWYASYADVIYETPLYKRGTTRMSMLYSDLIPEYVGPVRSARVNHVWIREEWDCAFAHHGGQKYRQTSIDTQFRELGADKKGVVFDGTTGAKVWNNYIKASEILTSPHNRYYEAAGLVTQVVPEDFKPANHTYKFADEAHEGGDSGEGIYITWGDKEYDTYLEWDDLDEVYYRYINKNPQNPVLYTETLPLIYKSDKPSDPANVGNPITFANVIVQFMNIEYPSIDAPLPTVTGTGNCEVFQCGRHYSGVWNRDTLQERTVFYDENGEEFPMQRGHTLIIMMDYQTEGRSVIYN